MGYYNREGNVILRNQYADIPDHRNTKREGLQFRDQRDFQYNKIEESKVKPSREGGVVYRLRPRYSNLETIYVEFHNYTDIIVRKDKMSIDAWRSVNNFHYVNVVALIHQHRLSNKPSKLS